MYGELSTPVTDLEALRIPTLSQLHKRRKRAGNARRRLPGLLARIDRAQRAGEQHLALLEARQRRAASLCARITAAAPSPQPTPLPSSPPPQLPPGTKPYPSTAATLVAGKTPHKPLKELPAKLPKPKNTPGDVNTAPDEQKKPKGKKKGR